MSCVVSGFLCPLFLILEYIPGLCTFSTYTGWLCMNIQFLSMGLYQLARLYYCFANDQIHSNKGYPKWVFIVMVIIGVIVIINLNISYIFIVASLMKRECGYSNRFEYYYRPVFHYFAGVYPWHYGTLLILLSWDAVTLLLYVWKIKTFTHITTSRRASDSDLKKQEHDTAVHSRIMSILHKIAILTLFYQFVTLFGMVFINTLHVIIGNEPMIYWILSHFMNGVLSFSLSVSMYLMMEHNKNEYVKFLRAVYYVRLYWLCCCCGHIVNDQLHELDDNIIELKNHVSGNANSVNAVQQNVHTPVEKIKTTGMELSIETITVVEH